MHSGRLKSLVELGFSPWEQFSRRGPAKNLFAFGRAPKQSEKLVVDPGLFSSAEAVGKRGPSVSVFEGQSAVALTAFLTARN